MILHIIYAALPLMPLVRHYAIAAAIAWLLIHATLRADAAILLLRCCY